MRVFCALLLVAVSSTAALAQREPEIVVPGVPGVPVYINGIDASWGIVEGEFGLDRPNEIAPTVIYRPALITFPRHVPSYYPADGRRPGYGRLEVVPPAKRRLPPPAPSYFRSWSTESEPGPVTEYAPSPQVLVTPNSNRGGRRSHAGRAGGGGGKGRR